MSYIKKSSKGVEECIFCDALRSPDEKHFVVYRSKHSIAMLNLYPYNTAHVMVAPAKHVPSIELLSDEELLDLWKTVNLMLKAIRIEYAPHGFNIGINMGKVAGAGIEQHVHVHVVPRWGGDTNFMPVLGNVKVLPEDLHSTWLRIKKALEDVMRGR
ncbi:MAG: HIT family hydrolase [Thermoprotei archaeon]|nr:MAG: HIT family hydrolase [Thermoprotei archaeon]